MITTVLLGLVALVACFQPNAPRLLAALIFVAATLAHEYVAVDATGLEYYGTAALLDLLIIVLTGGVDPIPAMVLRLHEVCLLSISINFAGWVMWSMYLPPDAYNVAFMGVYVWTLIIMIDRKDDEYVGGYSLDRWGTCFRFDRYTRLSRRIKNGGTL